MSVALEQENARLTKQLADMTDWAMRNEIAAPPLDWAALGEILRGATS